MRVPELIYGTAWKEEATARLVALALRTGFRGLDTANQRKHYHEAGVGAGLAEAIAEGVVRREDVFLQTKFTYARGQDHRLPYDPRAPLATQVRQSFERSLEHLRTRYVDSLVLHGPERSEGITSGDLEVWDAMASLVDDGRVRVLGVSNVSSAQLVELCDAVSAAPTFVQNRCYARQGWDAGVRAVCRERGIVYQGFSLLTANRALLEREELAAVAARLGCTRAQVVFQLARRIGILPLTGTTDGEHMRDDLAALVLALEPDEVARLEHLLSA